MLTINFGESSFPKLLMEINDPPKRLFVRGQLCGDSTKILTVVGARGYSTYGKEACSKLIAGLAGYNICIVSGLAMGIDAVAHRAALEAGLQTLAFPGSGLDDEVIYPSENVALAHEILASGGALVSEFDAKYRGAAWMFPKRNRLMAGIAHATLVIEANLKSGSLITSKQAIEYNRDVGAVPGQIFSSLTEGPHMLIRSGAIPITSSDDILEMLHIDKMEKLNPNGTDGTKSTTNSYGSKILSMLRREPMTRDQIKESLDIDMSTINTILSELEIDGFISMRSDKYFVIK